MILKKQIEAKLTTKKYLQKQVDHYKRLYQQSEERFNKSNVRNTQRTLNKEIFRLQTSNSQLHKACDGFVSVIEGLEKQIEELKKNV